MTVLTSVDRAEKYPKHPPEKFETGFAGVAPCPFVFVAN
jgi:hypothetical protein